MSIVRKQMSKPPADKQVSKIIKKYWGDPGGLIPVLQEVQELKGYLSREFLEQIAGEMHISLAKVIGVASFYSQFYLAPRGRHMIRVCSGTACHVRGGSGIFDELRDILKVNDGDTTEDLRFTLEKVSCLGACGLAPVMMIDEDTHPRLTKEVLPGILERYK